MTYKAAYERDAAGNPTRITDKNGDATTQSFDSLGSLTRGPERTVTGSDGSAYWTQDHYVTFMRIRGPR